MDKFYVGYLIMYGNEGSKKKKKKIPQKRYVNSYRKDVMSRDEIMQMFNRTDDKQLKAIMAIMCMTAGRISEVLLLKGKDFFTDQEYIYFTSYVLKKRDGIQRLTKKVKKTNQFYPYFREYINANNFVPENSIFTYKRSYVWKLIKQINPNSSPHLFRHAIATMLGQSGMDAFTLKQWMGWSKLEMAARYVHPENAVQTGSDVMEKLFTEE